MTMPRSVGRKTVRTIILALICFVLGVAVTLLAMSVVNEAGIGLIKAIAAGWRQ